MGLISTIAHMHNYTFLDDAASTEPPSVEALSPLSAELDEDNQEAVSVWLFQANPRRYDVVNALSDQQVGNRIHWLVNQHQSDIKAGHLGLIWVSGQDAGIYALTRVECNPRLLREFASEKQYWLDGTAPEEARRVEMTVVKRLINTPILRRELIKTEGLQDLSILRQAQGTNFPVRTREWKLLSQLL